MYFTTLYWKEIYWETLLFY